MTPPRVPRVELSKARAILHAALVCCLVATCILSGELSCRGGGRHPKQEGIAPAEQPRPGGILRVPVAVEPGSMNPLVARPGPQAQLWRYFYPSLVQLTPRGVRPPEVRLDLASRWEWSEESHTLTFYLRSDRYWQDTTRVRIGDVIQTYAAYRLTGRLHPKATRDSLLEPGLLSVEAGNDSTVRMHFAPHFSLWRAWPVTTWPILPAHKLGKLDPLMLESSPIGREPLSAGPFRLLDWRPGLNFWMGPNPAAPEGRRPLVRVVAFEPSPGIDSRILRLVLGQADLIPDVPVFRLGELVDEENNGVRVYAEGPASVEMILWSYGHPADAPALREAVSLAIDRDRLLSELASWRGTRFGGIAGGLLEPAGPGEPDSIAASVPFPHSSRAEADSVLDLAGWTDRDQDGFRLRAGLPLRVEMIYDRGSALRERMVTCLEEDLARVGIQLDPVALDAVSWQNRFRSGVFECALLGFTPPTIPDLSTMWASWGYWNRGGYASARVDSLVLAQEAAVNEADIVRCGRSIEAQIRRDRPATFLVYLDGVALLSDRVRGFTGSPFIPYGDLERVWLADTTVTSSDISEP
jgi:peptide/nickel transport system substrate-binding protein